jgi:glycosyltransferase involved in cell wall biosynthesis
MSLRLPRPLRLAVDGTPLLEVRPTGVARYARGLLQALLAGSHPVRLTLFVPDRGDVDFPHPEVEVVRLRPGPGYRYVRLGRALRQHRPHLLHSFFMAVPPPCGVPVAATVYEVPHVGAVRAEGCVRTLRQAVGWALARRWADGLAAISIHSARAARARGWGGRCLAVVPGGVENSAARVPLPLMPREIVAVGTLRRKKGVRLAVSAVERLNDRVGSGGPVRLTWIGAGRPPSADPALVSFPGYLPDEERDRLVRAAACLIVPSLTEGFGLPALEAMAAGCPVVVADAGALPEVVGRSGWVVPRATAECWAQVLEGVLAGGGEVARRVERAHKRAARFSWQRSATRLLGLYSCVLSSYSNGAG